VSEPLPTEELELPPAVVADRTVHRCEWCGRVLGDAVEARPLAADVGRKTHRYLPKTYRACDEACREQTTRFVRRHMALGPVLWTLAGLAFVVGVVALVSTLPPPMRLLWLDDGSLFALLGLLGALGVVTGVLVALLPFASISRRPEGEPPTVPLRRVRTFNRVMGVVMALLSAVVAVRVLLWL
jgi:hypothetical protein